MSGLRVSISMSMFTVVKARWTRVCPVCVSLYIYEHVYCCHCEMDKGYVPFACLCSYEYVYCYHSEMGTCMPGLRASISMSMYAAVAAKWTRVCPVCVSLCVLFYTQCETGVYDRFACLYMYEHVYCCHSEMGTCMSGLRVSVCTVLYTM